MATFGTSLLSLATCFIITDISVSLIFIIS
jgi:hypothetical protein